MPGNYSGHFHLSHKNNDTKVLLSTLVFQSLIQ